MLIAGEKYEVILGEGPGHHFKTGDIVEAINVNIDGDKGWFASRTGLQQILYITQVVPLHPIDSNLENK